MKRRQDENQSKNEKGTKSRVRFKPNTEISMVNYHKNHESLPKVNLSKKKLNQTIGDGDSDNRRP